MNFENLVIIILFILVLYSFINYSNCKEHFFVLDQKKCNETLVTDGTKFYIFKEKQPYIKGINPLVFNTLEEAEKKRNNNCKKIEIVNLLVNKDLEDPQENYERQCNKEYASYFHKVNNWGSLLLKRDNKGNVIKGTEELVTKCLDIKNNVDTDSKIENCMRKKLSDNELKKKLFYF